MRVRSTARSAQLKEAIISSFKADACVLKPSFDRFNDADWTSVMWWLDISGTAIYFLHQAHQIGVEESLPRAVREGLERRLENNRLRMQSLLEQSHATAALFDAAGVRYALLKGFTLTPESVPESAMRSQSDLDFLADSRDAEIAIRCIEKMGYVQYGKFGSTMEFKAGPASWPDLSNMYSNRTQRALELHLLPEGLPEPNLLTRRVARFYSGLSIYALSPADIMVQQSIHLLKHLCGEHTRLSWVLEFWRHAVARRSDRQFWSEAIDRSMETWNGDLAMGIAFRVAGEFFGETGAVLPEQWQSDALPARVKMWIERYARPLITSDRIGNKLYALLRKEVPCAPHDERKTRDILLPRVLPNRLLEPLPQERLGDRLDRYAVEMKFFLQRLGFHIRESLRLVFESARWNRATAKVER